MRQNNTALEITLYIPEIKYLDNGKMFMAPVS